MSIFSTVDSDLLENADLSLTSNLVHGGTAKVGYGIARNKAELDALVEQTFGKDHRHEIEDPEAMFDAGLGIMLVITPAYRDNYTYSCATVLSMGDADPETTDGEPGCAEYMIRLLSTEQAGDDDHESAAYTDRPMHAAILLAVPDYATSVRVWVLPPEADDEEAELLDPYPTNGQPLIKSRPRSTPAHSQEAMDLAGMPRPGRVN